MQNAQRVTVVEVSADVTSALPEDIECQFDWRGEILREAGGRNSFCRRKFVINICKIIKTFEG